MWSGDSKWLGDYLGAGVTSISLWGGVSNGDSPIRMRVAFRGEGGWFYSEAMSARTGRGVLTCDLSGGNFFILLELEPGFLATL